MAHVMSEREERLNRHRTGELAGSPAGLPVAGLVETDRASLVDSERSDKPRLEAAATGVIVLAWTIQFLSFSLERFLRDPGAESWPKVEARAIVTALGALISFAILKALQRCTGMSFLKRAMVALALALAGATIHGVLNTLVFTAFLGDPGGGFSVESFAALVYLFGWVYLAITVLLLSLTYGEELLQRERRISQLKLEGDRARLKALRYQLNPDGDAHVWLRKGSERIRVDVTNIDWVAAEGEYVRFHCGANSYLDRQSMSTVEQRLAPFGFVRIHRSAVVNAGKIERLTRTRWGSLLARLRSGDELRVSRSFQPVVRVLIEGAPNEG